MGDEDRQLPLPRRTDSSDDHSIKIKLEEKEHRENGGVEGGELEEKQRFCDFCGKGFDSGKALGGHRRIHLIDQKKPRKVDEPDRDSQHPCCLCGKSFRSEKSLFGHMRFHPERTWRGIKPPPAAAGNKHSSSSTISDEVDEPDQEESGEPVDLIGSLSGWTRTDRRGKRSTYQEPSDEVDEDQTDDSNYDGTVPDDAAAHSLLYLSQDTKEKVKIECKDDNDISGLKKRKVDDDVEEPKERFRCGTCNRTFSKFQALGGHRSSHAKNVAGESTSSDHRNRCEEGNNNGQEHRCKICDKSFLSGQALGGHQRRHWSGPAASPSAEGERETTTSGFGNGRRNLLIDLNELPPEEEEEGGSGGAESAFNPGINQY